LKESAAIYTSFFEQGVAFSQDWSDSARQATGYAHFAFYYYPMVCNDIRTAGGANIFTGGNEFYPNLIVKIKNKKSKQLLANP